jgi:hypothetical protein
VTARQEIINTIYLALRTRTNQAGRLTLSKLSEHAGSLCPPTTSRIQSGPTAKIGSPWSLDEVVQGTVGLRRIDTISEGLW